MTKVTKTSVVIRIMTEHKDKPMDEVTKLIEKELPCKEGYGKVWYRWAIKEGVAPGKLETATKGKAKTKEVPAKKLLKEVGIKPAKTKGNRFTGKIKETAPKTASDIEQIKAANLKRMQEITARNKVIRNQYNGNIARDADAPFDPDDFTEASARAEIEAADELESFSSPRFLNKDQVKALV